MYFLLNIQRTEVNYDNPSCENLVLYNITFISVLIGSSKVHGNNPGLKYFCIADLCQDSTYKNFSTSWYKNKYILLHNWEGNIQFEAGSIGPSAAMDNTKAENGIFPNISRPKGVQ